MREAIAAIVGVVSPLATGWLLVTFGPRVAFGTTAVILVFAALPFLRTPDIKVAPQAVGSLRAPTNTAGAEPRLTATCGTRAGMNM